MNVVITDAAVQDLIEIGDFIHAHNPVRAASFVNELIDRCHDLAETPLAFPLIPRYERYEIRRRVYQDFLIFYRVGKDRIEVIHILRGARDHEALLFPKE